MHMLSKKDLSSEELETLWGSRTSTMVVTANGEVETNDEAQVHLYDHDLFITVQLLEDTPAVLSLGKLCEENGYSHEWASGQNPHLTKQGEKILRKTENFVPFVVPGLSSNSGTVRLLHRYRRTHIVHLQVQLKSEMLIWHQETGAIHQKHETFKKRDNNRASGNRLRDLP